MAWNCKTPCDYIEKSLTQHPSMFEESMMNSAKIHRRAAGEMLNHQARQSAIRMAEQCEAIALQSRNVGIDDIHTPRFVAEIIIAAGVGSWVQAFHNAARLNCIGQLAQTIVAEYPEGK